MSRVVLTVRCSHSFLVTYERLIDWTKFSLLLITPDSIQIGHRGCSKYSRWLSLTEIKVITCYMGISCVPSQAKWDGNNILNSWEEESPETFYRHGVDVKVSHYIYHHKCHTHSEEFGVEPVGGIFLTFDELLKGKKECKRQGWDGVHDGSKCYC